MAIDRNNLRSDPWGSGLILITVLFVVFASAALVIYTRRIEFAILGGTPVALLLLSNYRLATMVTVWVVLIWMLRWPFMFFEVLQFSYVVYASVALTIGAYLLRLATPGRRHLPLTGNGWLWLLVGTVIAGGVHGASNVGSIPPWLLSRTRCGSGSAVDLLQNGGSARRAAPADRHSRGRVDLRQGKADRVADTCLDAGLRDSGPDRRGNRPVRRGAVGDCDAAKRASDHARLSLQ